ncbi:MAG: phosphoheptose isomerase [Flavobacteriales bacterium]|nr:phosphoheptose isomerase [Flavobacteriales bacterium]
MTDIDGTTCEDIPNEEPERKRLMPPSTLMPAETCNRWYEQETLSPSSLRDWAHREVTEAWAEQARLQVSMWHRIRQNRVGGNYHWIDNHDVRLDTAVGNPTDMVRRM